MCSSLDTSARHSLVLRAAVTSPQYSQIQGPFLTARPTSSGVLTKESGICLLSGAPGVFRTQIPPTAPPVLAPSSPDPPTPLLRCSTFLPPLFQPSHDDKAHGGYAICEEKMNSSPSLFQSHRPTCLTYLKTASSSSHPLTLKLLRGLNRGLTT